MEEKFIYVFDAKSRDALIAAGYELLKSDEKNSTFVFTNDRKLRFSFNEITYFPSNKLTF